MVSQHQKGLNHPYASDLESDRAAEISICAENRAVASACTWLLRKIGPGNASLRLVGVQFQQLAFHKSAETSKTNTIYQCNSVHTLSLIFHCRNQVTFAKKIHRWFSADSLPKQRQRGTSDHGHDHEVGASARQVAQIGIHGAGRKTHLADLAVSSRFETVS